MTPTTDINNITFDKSPESLYNLIKQLEQYRPLLSLLDNRKSPPDALKSDLKGESDMSKRHKQRVKIGLDENNKPIYKWVDGYSIDELNDNIVKVYIEYDLLGRLTKKKLFAEEGSRAKPTFKEYMDKWFETYKTPTLKPTTLRGYRSNMQTHIYPFFGEKRIDEIHTDDIQTFMNERQHLARNTMHTMLVLISEVLESACEDGLIEVNPAASKRLSIPSKGKKERDALKPEQIKEIIEAIPTLGNPDERKLLALLIFTGMRRGEVLGLRWEDIDFAKKLIHVEQNVTFAENQPRVGSTKTKSGKRIIPLDDRLAEFLKPFGKSGYIIGGEKPVTDMVFRRLYRNISEKVNLYGATPHVFRHTYITMLAKSGVDLKTVQKISGHADISTTLNINTHTREAEIQNAGVRLAGLMGA